jgi:hypothetical protein
LAPIELPASNSWFGDLTRGPWSPSQIIAKVEQLTREFEGAFPEIFRHGVSHAGELFNKRANPYS